MPSIDMIGLDADDTLWHNEINYNTAEQEFARLLSNYHDEEWVRGRLFEVESRNMTHFGYGAKAFVLSMIETGVQLTEGRISGEDVGKLVELAKWLVNAPVELLPHVAETLPTLAARCPLILITKGDLLDQENKVTRSGLREHFSQIEVVSHKTPESYLRLLRRHNTAPGHFMMVGNSLKSDVLPVMALGGTGVHIPYALTWAHEHATAPAAGSPGFYEVEHFGLLPALLEKINQ